MAKVSEMSIGDLERFIVKFEQKIQSGEDVEESEKKLAILKKEFSKRAVKNNIEEESDNEIIKHHSSEIDYSGYEAASFGSRAVAIIVDGIIVGVPNQVISVGFGMLMKGQKDPIILLVLTILSFLVGMALPVAYAVFFLRRDGQTLGKKLMNLKVLNDDSSEDLSVKTILLREVLGKFISSIVFLLGYLIVLFGKDSFHDRIAKTRVIKLK